MTPSQPPNLLCVVLLGLVRVLKAVLEGDKKRKKTSKHFEAPKVSGPPAPPIIGGVKSLKDLGWDEFELLVGEIYRRRGYKVQMSTGDGSDGGVDLWLRNPHETTIVQCKRWNNTKVAAKEIREFFGVLVSEKVTWGIFVTTSEFTRDARGFAEGKPIVLVDRLALGKLMEEVKMGADDNLLDLNRWLPTFKQEVIIVDPVCPYCRSRMAFRRGRNGSFWGCSKFPRCKGTRQIRKHLPVVSF